MGAEARRAETKICAEKQRLSEQLFEKIRTIAHLQSGQATNLVDGGLGLPQIDVSLKAARENWDRAKEAYILHVREHGC